MTISNAAQVKIALINYHIIRGYNIQIKENKHTIETRDYKRQPGPWNPVERVTYLKT